MRRYFENNNKEKAPRSAYEAMEEIANALERVRFYDYVDQSQKPWRLIWKSFLRGIAQGFGFVIGTTIVIWLLATLMSKLGGLPAVGRFFEFIGNLLVTPPTSQ